MAGTITHVGEGTAAANTAAGTTLAVPFPASITAGDVLVLGVLVSSATLPSNPGGWTSAGTSTSGGSSPSLRVSVLKATGSETGSLSVTTPNATSQGWMMQFRGVDQTTQIDVSATVFGSSTATAAYDLPTLTTTLVGATLVYFGCGNTAAGTFTPPTVPATFTEVRDLATTTPKATSGYLIWSSSGASGTVNLVSSSSVRGAGVLIALRPISYSTALATTLDGATFVGAASVTASISASLATTLAGASLVGAASETIPTSLATTLAGATLAASVTETIPGHLTTTLAGAIFTGAAAETIAGHLVASLAGASLAATAVESIPAALTSTLDGATLVGAASSVFIIHASLQATLDGATLAATGWSGFPRDLTLTGALLSPRVAGITVRPLLAATLLEPRISGQREA